MVKVCLLLFLVCSSVNSKAVFACSCMESSSPTIEIQNATAVFSGTVTEVSQSAQYDKKVTFDVEKNWKGFNSSSISVTTSSDSASCGNSYEVGQTWLVYAYGKANLSTSLCSRTKQIKHAEEDLNVLGEGRIAPPLPLRTSNIVPIALVLLNGVAIAWALRKWKN